MPSTKKRINLTIPDDVYPRILDYKIKNGLESDATACLQLIVQQLNGLEKTKLLLDFIQGSNLDQLMQVSSEGIQTIKNMADNQKKE